MHATFRLFTFFLAKIDETATPFFSLGVHGLCRHGISNGLVPLVMERIVRDLVLSNVVPYLCVGPVREWIEFESKIGAGWTFGIVVGCHFVHFQYAQFASFPTLTPSPSRDPNLGTMLFQRPSGRFNFGQVRILFVIGFVKIVSMHHIKVLPACRVCFGFPCGHVDGMSKVCRLFLQALNEIICFWKQVESVNGNDRHGRCQIHLVQGVKNDHSGGPKTRHVNQLPLPFFSLFVFIICVWHGSVRPSQYLVQ
mmetsp:Transcript_13812/g.30229  ORF Transcript_13812/g.30229 Transcript_13812/m.30229 type:complete len:252 (-) Transcript_13812:265-1020(-)